MENHQAERKKKSHSPDMAVEKKAELVLCAVINLSSFTESIDLSKPYRFITLQGLADLYKENDNFSLRFKK